MSAAPPTADQNPTLTVDGKIYAGWTSLRVSRGLDRCASDFDIAVSERWPEQDEPWLIQPFAECVVSIGPDPVLTGYVDGYQPMFDRAAHGVRILGRSRTEDLIDCTPDIQSGQFAGYTAGGDRAVHLRPVQDRRGGRDRRRRRPSWRTQNSNDARPPGPSSNGCAGSPGCWPATMARVAWCSPAPARRVPLAASSRGRTSCARNRRSTCTDGSRITS